MKKKDFLKKKKKGKEKGKLHNNNLHHRLNKSTEVVTIPANAPTTLTTPHLV